MEVMYTKGQPVEFNWGDEKMSGVVEKSSSGWVMILPTGYHGVFAVRATQVWLPGEEAKEPDSGVQLESALPSEAAADEVVAT